MTTIEWLDKALTTILKNCSTYLNSNKSTVITTENEDRNRLSVHLTKIPQKYTCPLRRQLSALRPRRERTQACKPIHGHYRSNGQNIGHLNLGLLVGNAIQIVGLH